MEILLILVPLTLIIVAVGAILFSWAVKNGQYDDLEGPAHRILYDDDRDMIPEDVRPDDKSQAAKREARDDATDSSEEEPKS
ncbi:cbb3-type cytochrome oxidase assembly protein CcoS [Marinobacter xestospongiae]|uniref:cbb3-type cytochrome oxidase assembly protein CcoS n=1 Tax=Marinobacter xestospongiae TaxID=994319 RepID=UPI00200551C5|nr:cbb3-type cytochrome oxidase assembly protein CcoS [Marinobacter xestospongiae]